MGLFGFVKNIVPSGTKLGDILGSNRPKGTGFLGIHIGKKEFQKTATAPAPEPPKPGAQNILITGLLVLLGGFILISFIR